MWAMSGHPLHISGLTWRGCPKGHAEWLPLSVVPPGGRKTHILTHTLQRALLLLLCVKAFPPVTGAVGRVERCVKYQSEMAGGWAAAHTDGGSGPAVDLISPMGLLAEESLPNMIHMCYILSGPLPGFVA